MPADVPVIASPGGGYPEEVETFWNSGGNAGYGVDYDIGHLPEGRCGALGGVAEVLTKFRIINREHDLNPEPTQGG